MSRPGPGRDSALRASYRRGLTFSFVCDVTPMLYNICGPPRKTCLNYLSIGEDMFFYTILLASLNDFV